MTTEAASLTAARSAHGDDIALLRERARALARPVRTPDTAAAGDTFQAVVFSLGDERYAIDTRHVLRVEVLRQLTPLPGAAAPLHGLTQWRGDVLTLLDLRSVLGASLKGIVDMGRMVVIEADRRFGILVERLLDIRLIGPQGLKPLPRDDAEARTLLHGLTDDGILVIDDAALIALFGTSPAAHQEQEGAIK